MIEADLNGAPSANGVRVQALGGGVLVLTPPRRLDPRGWFMEVYSEAWSQTAGLDVRFVQDNHSFSAAAGTVRGLHFQNPPRAQAKLVRCLRGAVLDCAVDIRLGSPTYGRAFTARLSAEGGEQMFVPIGFAHGFATLEPQTEVAYKVSDIYAPGQEGGLFWRDPGLAVDWPIAAEAAVLSDKDAALPGLSQLRSPFVYGRD